MAGVSALRRWGVRGAGLAVAGAATYQFFAPVKEDKDFSGTPLKRKIQRFNSLVERGQDPQSIKTRGEQVKALKAGEPFDVLIVGGGCTGSGAALDAATRGLKTACIERGDFANETSSRSSKLIWGGFKYLQVAFAELLNRRTLYQPVSSVNKFLGEFWMVYECCQERSWLAGQQPHLVRYVPQAVPFTSFFQWPPFFDHPFYSILPVLALPAFLFYDALASWHSPSSYAMGPKKTKEVFPQMSDVLYSAVYCEAMHNDARTGTAIALTAALKGATVANYVEMVGLVYGGPKGATVTGVKCVDKISGEEFEVKAKAVVLATGPFLDKVRKMDKPDCEKAVMAAAGVHIVLPGYFTPGGMGFAQLRTKRGATMYFLPWQGHTVVGSTDKKCDATSSPAVEEDEIQYLVNEAASCLSTDIRVRRSDVLSAWQGWRPLYRDPNAPPGAPVSRHHVIGIDDETGITFICGGKWSTYRAMAEELIDKVVEHHKFKHAGPGISRSIKLLGGEGYHDLLHVQLVQQFGVSDVVAQHLTHTYGACAFAVCELAAKTKKLSKGKAGAPTDGTHRFGQLIVDGYPYIEPEIEYACKYEYAMTVKDMLTTRMRLAFLNREAALGAIPRVADIMAESLSWSKAEKEKQIKDAKDYVGQFGGPIADKRSAKLRSATFTDLHEAFASADADTDGLIASKELEKAALKLGFPFKNNADVDTTFKSIDTNGTGKISEMQFIEWWNNASAASAKKLAKTISLTAANEVALEKLITEHKEELEKKKKGK